MAKNFAQALCVCIWHYSNYCIAGNFRWCKFSWKSLWTLQRKFSWFYKFSCHLPLWPYPYTNFCLFYFHCSRFVSENHKNLHPTKISRYMVLAPTSVCLSAVSALLVHARLTATYWACLWSIRACTMTSPHTDHIQATAARPHGCNNWAKYFRQRVPTLFPG